jgi:hypothetical protein
MFGFKFGSGMLKIIKHPAPVEGRVTTYLFISTELNHG